MQNRCVVSQNNKRMEYEEQEVEQQSSLENPEKIDDDENCATYNRARAHSNTMCMAEQA